MPDEDFSPTRSLKAITFPTRPGAYWYQPLGLLSATLLEVQLTNGVLTVWWANRDIAIERLKGSWHGPIPPATDPASRQELE